MRRATLTAALLATAGLGWAALQPWPRPHYPARQGAAIGDTRTWGLQLQNVVALSIPANVDLLVVDYSRDGTDWHALTPDRIADLKTRKGSGDRIVLCYMSIGEAENYRYYWRKRWDADPPAWLGKENAEWKGNFQVHYWSPDWQDLIVGPAPTVLTRLREMIWPERKPYLERILEAGCDGVYLDRIDAFAEWQSERGEAAETDMARFVERISTYARAHRPGFLVVAQNGEELLQRQSYRDALDGVAKEDFLFGVGGDENANAPEMITTTRKLLDRMKSAGKPVFVVEYVSDPNKRAEVLKSLRGLGYLPLFAARALSATPEPTEPQPGPPIASPSTAPSPAQR